MDVISFRRFSKVEITSSEAPGSSCKINPPAWRTVLSLFISTPRATLEGVCSEVAKQQVKSSAISLATRIVWPTYGSFKPISLMTLNTPIPRAPPTSSFPFSFGGSITSGLQAQPLTSPLESAVTVKPPIGPSPSILMVRMSSAPFIITPIMAPAVRRRPRAAVATGLVL